MNIEKILDIIFPKICGICGKINGNYLCNKCYLELKKQEEAEIIVDKEEMENRYFEELMYIFKYEGLIRKLILDYKFNEDSYMYKTFVNFLIKNEKIFQNIKKYDTIIPVPISRKRFNQRGYNQSALIAREIAKQTNLEFRNNCLIKVKNTIEQSKLNKEERQNNIKGVYRIQYNKNLENKKILIIDDIYTTGNTVNECCKEIRKLNPNKIGVLVLAKD